MTPDHLTKLIIRTSLGDRAAFDELYRHTSAKLFGVCLRVLRNREDAEEALQEVYVKVWTKADRYGVCELSPITWLVAIARNHAIDRLRSRAGALRLPSEELDAAGEVADDRPSPEALALASAERQRIDECLDELEQVRGDAVRGAYLRGDSYSELAARYNVPLNTMRTWLRRSLMKLKECLER